ncbi:MAG: diacylglycerol kinase family protein [Sphingomicrobium sp.]
MSQRLRSFSFAWAGLRYLIASEHNARIHLGATVLVLVAAAGLGVDRIEFLLLLIAIGWVWFAEAVNTSIERLADAVTLEHHPQLKLAKDLSAAAVLIGSIVAAAIGIVIFLPRVIDLLAL